MHAMASNCALSGLRLPAAVPCGADGSRQAGRARLESSFSAGVRLLDCSGRKLPLLRRAAAGARCDGAPQAQAVEATEPFDSKTFRHNLTRSENYNRQGFGHKKEMLAQMDKEYTSEFFERIV